MTHERDNFLSEPAKPVSKSVKGGLFEAVSRDRLQSTQNHENAGNREIQHQRRT